MKAINLFAAIAFLGVAGCSNKTTYENIQLQMERDCQLAATADEHQRCSTTLSLKYDEYQRQRDALREEQ